MTIRRGRAGSASGARRRVPELNPEAHKGSKEAKESFDPGRLRTRWDCAGSRRPGVVPSRRRRVGWRDGPGANDIPAANRVQTADGKSGFVWYMSWSRTAEDRIGVKAARQSEVKVANNKESASSWRRRSPCMGAFAKMTSRADITPAP